MATYKAFMRPSLEYASSTWSLLASLTSIKQTESHAEHSMENCHRMHTINKHPRLTIQTENKTFITSPTQTYNILQHSRAKKNTIFNNGHYTTNIPTDSHTVTTTDIKTNIRHIHTSIVSRHLVTRGNNKILRTPPPHISSSEETLPRASLVAPFPK